jgi:hyperosmotically inducible protein
MRPINKFGAFLGLAVLLAVPAGLSAKAPTTGGSLESRVRHELVMLPYYNVFDNLTFRVEDRTVVLSGAVTDPVVKSDAEHAVKRLEGVERVTNDIEVLPLSPFDNQIRWSTCRAIYGYGPLQRYVLGTIPSIHILVKNGHVTLEGVVANEQDKQLAYVRANGVPSVFSVTNNLRIDS